MEAALESVKKTLRISDSRGKYTTWLACLTTDQKVAIVESEDTKNWINMCLGKTWSLESFRQTLFRQFLNLFLPPSIRS